MRFLSVIYFSINFLKNKKLENFKQYNMKIYLIPNSNKIKKNLLFGKKVKMKNNILQFF